MAREVSCRALEIYFTLLSERGIDAVEFFRGMPYTVEQLREQDRRIDWSVFVDATRRMEQLLTEAEIVEMGATTFKVGRLLFALRVGQLLASARQFYRWANRFGANALFNNVVSEMSEDDQGIIRLKVRIPPQYEPSRGYFLIAQGVTRSMPTIIGLPPSEVTLETDGRVGTYIIRPPRSRTIFSRLKGLFRRARAVDTTIRELEQSQVLLEARYHELEDAKRRIEVQTRILELVNRITTAAIRKQRLGPMLTTIVEELQQGMKLEAVEVHVEVLEEEMSFRMTEQRGAAEALAAPDSFTEPLGEPPLGRLRVSRGSRALSEEDRDAVRQVARSAGLVIGNAVAFEVIRSYREELEERVKHRTMELSEARDQIARSLESRNRFFANINHELRTPLTVILLGLERLGAMPGFDAEFARPLESMRRNAERLRSLVDDLLLLAAGSEVNSQLRLSSVNVEKLLDEVVGALRTQAEAKGLHLTFSCAPGLEVEGDRRALDRALFNLTSNAIKYTLQGQVTVRARAEGEEVVFEVEDTGEGIPAEYLERAFERFVQVPGAKSRPGAGIGLALVKEIVAQHQGSVKAKSELGKGSLFTLRLPRQANEEVRQRSEQVELSAPIVEAPSPEQPPLPPREEAPRGWARVLVCEDNPDLGPYTRQILLDAGIRVTLVTSAEEALEVARREPPDLLLTDLGLRGGMDGVQLCQAFSRLKEHQNAPCLVLTANSLPGIRMEAYEAGAVDYIVKPFGPNELVARVNAQLKLRRLSLQLLASERMAAQGTALAGVAHELRNPLNALINSIEPLRGSLPPEALGEGTIAGELLEILEDCGRRVAQLSFELLSVTRVPSSVTETLDLTDVLARARKLMEPKLRKVELRLHLGEVGQVRASGTQLSQVVCNVLENAIDAAGDGGWIEVRSAREAGRVIMDVQDSGPGVPLPLRDRIFEPFFTTKDPGKGTGLGLSISRTIMRRFGGDLEIPQDSVPTVFRLWLPEEAAAVPG